MSYIQFNCVNGSSFSDVCLNTYGSMDYYVKLLNDNNLEPDDVPFSGQAIMWDNSLVTDEGIQQQTIANNIIYATDTGYYATPLIPTTITNTNDTMILNDTALLDNELVISHTLLQNTSASSAAVIGVIVGIKQMTNTQYIHDAVAGTVTLTNGATMAKGDTTFIMVNTTTTSVMASSTSVATATTVTGSVETGALSTQAGAETETQDLLRQ